MGRQGRRRRRGPRNPPGGTPAAWTRSDAGDSNGYSIMQADSTGAPVGVLDRHPHLSMPGNSTLASTQLAPSRCSWELACESAASTSDGPTPSSPAATPIPQAGVHPLS